ncbi:aconitate hydratase AcnA [Cellvibrio polysaccharolyticus]|uniref:Aconitate hydratase n=1 Tax=Cellvibrio polysaccharolyticus TaxID=2082724 RepID=A0A928V4T1_9GAMM|nr:aconitate hydratase AcnA [Cellvibrio polysaccharolyticus]MBE8718778.1 aconitate hydratase AcnA [Cellvibrio polysaccharolyticus]
MTTSLQSVETLTVAGKSWRIYPFNKVAESFDLDRLPYSLKILLENLLRHAQSNFVSDEDIRALAGWNPQAEPDREIAFVPARVVLQDFTGVPAIVDLAAMRDAVVALGGNAERINPLSPVELVIDHSVMVDFFGDDSALQKNTAIEIERNRERYQFLRWGQKAFSNFKVVPPGTGIVHQVNLEYLARGVFTREENDLREIYPDTLVGTDSHTTMINGLGVLGWGVGGIEAEAAMLGQPISMLIPQVVGFRLTGKLPEGTTATDLVLTVTQMLRSLGVVGKFVEFFGPGLKNLTLADRATIGNMAPEYGATCGIFPVDQQTLDYLRFTGRSEAQLELTETYMKAMGLWHDDNTPEANYSHTLTLDLRDVVPSIAGPRRPQDKIPLTDAKARFERSLSDYQASRRNVIHSTAEGNFASEGGGTATGQQQSREGEVAVDYRDKHFSLKHGAVVIAAITSCTNTSNPAVLIAAGLVARKARSLGLNSKPWVKTSLAPGSQVVTEYLQKAGLMEDLEALGFYLVGYGCTTCIGNSGPLPAEISDAIRQGDLLASAVLSGNRNFEGRIHAEVRNNYLASPPLVVAYAIAGTLQIDLTTDPIGYRDDASPVYLKDIWPSNEEIQQTIQTALEPDMFTRTYADVYRGDEHWNALPVTESQRYAWPESDYVRKPPFFDDMPAQPQPLQAVASARCLVMVGDSITTDHISPAGSIMPNSPAGLYLQQRGVTPADFNSYGSRRGNHEVMMRGTFANVRLKNRMAPDTEGSWTTWLPGNEVMSIYDASERYRADGTPLIVLAGKEYGSGSSRDWAAKGPALLGVKAVIAESYERIHRSNLVGMGILPLQFEAGESAESLHLSGREIFDIPAITADTDKLTITARSPEGNGAIVFNVKVRIDTANEFNYFLHGGILHYVLRNLAENKS